MLTTHRQDWDDLFRLWRQHGMSIPDAQRHTSREVVFESYLSLGYNYRMTDIQAAIGRQQLQRLPQMIGRRRWQASRYGELLGDLSGVALPTEPSWARSNWQSFCLRLVDHHDQRWLMQAMLEAGISTRRGIMCAHREPAYPRGTWSCGPKDNSCECPPGVCMRLRESEKAQDRGVLLPLFHQLTESDQDRVAVTLRHLLS
jgi:dTDP-4-amino-4,6-dideoxygalactose transaminase